MIRITLLCLLLAGALPGPAQDFQDLEKKTSDFTLPNGLRVVVSERHDVPVVSFVTHIGVGTAHDPAGSAGLARFYEHLAYKGAESFGTTDPAAEKKALDAVEEAYDRLEAERAKGRQANDVKVLGLDLELRKALSAAQGYAIPNEYLRILGDAGATNIGVGVSADYTQLQATLPSNRAELWFAVEAQRLGHPSFRDFYRDRDDSVTEYRNRTERNAQNKILQTLLAAAFTAHPYRNPMYGWPSDFAALRLSAARQFFGRYLVPANMVVSIAGDMKPEEAKRLAERYFGPMPARPLPPAIQTQEPPQAGPRTVVIDNAPESALAIGFKRPDALDRDDAVLDVMQMLLAGGRSSLLWQELIETRRIATTVRAFSTLPGSRGPHLFAILIGAAPGRSAEENEKAVSAVLAGLQKTPVDEAVLGRARSQVRAAFVQRLSDNVSIASNLALYAFDYGDWRKLFAAADAFSKVTASQVQVAAIKYFTPQRRTSVLMVPPPPVRPEATRGAAQ